MKFLKQAVASVLAITMTAAPAVANPAQSLSVAQRAGAEMSEESNQLETNYIIGVVVLIAVGIGLYLILDEDDGVSV